QFGESPYQPLRRINLPWLDAISVIVLKLVMKVMVSLAQGNNSHQPRVAGAALRRVGTGPNVVAKRVNAERAMLENNQAGNSRDEKRSKGRAPSAPCIANDRGKYKRNQCSEPMNIAMLPHHERIFLQIGDVVERRTGIELEKEPADVRVK